jgi:hypothetical protein
LKQQNDNLFTEISQIKIEKTKLDCKLKDSNHELIETQTQLRHSLEDKELMTKKLIEINKKNELKANDQGSAEMRLQQQLERVNEQLNQQIASRKEMESLLKAKLSTVMKASGSINESTIKQTVDKHFNLNFGEMLDELVGQNHTYSNEITTLKAEIDELKTKLTGSAVSFLTRCNFSLNINDQEILTYLLE